MSETVEQFLARGGQIKPLAMGYTAFPDGNIPMRPKPRKSDIVETPTAVIQEKNKTIKTRKKIEPRPKIPDEQVKLQIAEQIEKLNEFFSKTFHGDKKRFCSLVGLTPKTIDNARCGHGRIGIEKWKEVKLIMADFVFSKSKAKTKRSYKRRDPVEAERRNQVFEARTQAKENGETVFMAPCKHHGMTKFYLHGDQPPRCATCRMNNTKHLRNLHKDAEQKSKAERSEYNRAKVKEAASSGLKIFTGLCVRCGYTEMKYSKSPNTLNGYTYRCVECNKKTQALYKETRNKL